MLDADRAVALPWHCDSEARRQTGREDQDSGAREGHRQLITRQRNLDMWGKGKTVKVAYSC